MWFPCTTAERTLQPHSSALQAQPHAWPLPRPPRSAHPHPNRPRPFGGRGQGRGRGLARRMGVASGPRSQWDALPPRAGIRRGDGGPRVRFPSPPPRFVCSPLPVLRAVPSPVRPHVRADGASVLPLSSLPGFLLPPGARLQRAALSLGPRGAVPCAQTVHRRRILRRHRRGGAVLLPPRGRTRRFPHRLRAGVG